MSAVLGEHGTVHFPKRRDVFQFDEDVASHFPEMAQRSIPMYNEVHRLHASLLRSYLVPGAVIVDIGSSTGKTFQSIEQALGLPLWDSKITAYAVDDSEAMMSRLSKAFPSAICWVDDVRVLPPLPEKADIMFAYYVLQFIPHTDRMPVLRWMAANLKPGGVLVLGQKDGLSGVPLSTEIDEEYYKFRRDNGYTQQEIDAKTAALKNSMWPVTATCTRVELDAAMFDAVETSRWLHFSTIMAVKRG